jgi:hypothetical protein
MGHVGLIESLAEGWEQTPSTQAVDTDFRIYKVLYFCSDGNIKVLLCSRKEATRIPC